MKRYYARWVFMLCMAFAVAGLAGCAKAPTPTVAPAATPTEAPAPTPGEPRRGGTLKICDWDELTNYNPYICCILGYDPQAGAILERLITFDPDGNPVPVLTTEVPTKENGGVSEDGKTITYHLRPGVKWADGEPFTSEDVKFSYEYIMKPENMVSSRAGFELVEEVETPDELTAVVHYKQYYAPWMTIPWFIIPKHILETEPDFNDVEWDYMLLGTGPFYMCENVAGDHVTLCRNEYYWQEGKPYLDQIVILWIADREAQKARFEAGDCNLIIDLVESDVAAMNELEGVEAFVRAGGMVERLWLNLSANSGPHMGDPNYPHFFLGDVRVRQALELAINKQEMLNTVLAGVPQVGTGECPSGWAELDIAPSEYNPEKAKQLLEEAGWIDTDEDGVRECHGCLYANEGDRASIMLATTAAKFRQLDAQMIQAYFEDLGVELKVETKGYELWGGYNEGGSGAIGAFDIDMWTELCWVDPAPTLEQLYAANAIPSPENSAGRNRMRFLNEEYTTALEQGASALTREDRAKAYKRAQEILLEEKPIIYLFNRGNIGAVRTTKVKGWMPPEGKLNPWLYLANYYVNVYLVQE